jgi:CHAD domain-containing protein
LSAQKSASSAPRNGGAGGSTPQLGSVPPVDFGVFSKTQGLSGKLLNKSVRDGYRKSKKAIKKKSKAFLREPTRDNVHAIRTALRRSDAALRLSPKGTKKSRSVKLLLKKQKKALKSTARVRDFDIIRSRLLTNPSSAPRDQLLKQVEMARQRSLEDAVDAVSSVRKKMRSMPPSGELADSRLDRRFEKTADKLAARIEKRVPVVIQNPSNKGEMHALRIDCKRLRYTLDLTGSQRYSRLINLLQSWQDELGSIRDSDVTIEYLGNQKGAQEFHLFAEAETTRRNKNFEAFMKTVKSGRLLQ